MEKAELMEDEEVDMDQKGEDVGDDPRDVSGDVSGIDTTPAFHSIFQGKDNFESWEEFITPFEEFQMLTNSVFKPKSSVCVNWINEKRTSDKIPEKFVYSKVNMICQHFGIGVRKEGSTRKRESYVGQDCEAFVKLSYKKGSLHITKYNLVHTNHSLNKTVAKAQMRKIRPVIFDDDLDLLLSKVSEDSNVFENRTAESNWQTAVGQLTRADQKLEHLTRRMLKKRLHFLMERYAANCEGSEPLEDDEMGQILHRLLTQKEKIMTPINRSKRGRKKKYTPVSVTSSGRPRGRPRKHPVGEEDADDDDYDDYGGTGLDMTVDDDDEDNTSRSRSSNGFSSGSRNALSNAEISSFLHYWTKRDADERRMRWEEVRLRKEELELQKSRFEMEQKERQTLLELLKAQSQIVSSLRKSPVVQQAASTPIKGGTTKEYILNKDGTLQPVMSDHDEHNKVQSAVMTVNSHGMTAHTGNMNTMSGHVAAMPVHSHSGTMTAHQVHAVPMSAHGMATHPTANMTAHPHGNMATHGHAGAMHGHGGMPGHGGMGGHMPGHH